MVQESYLEHSVFTERRGKIYMIRIAICDDDIKLTGQLEYIIEKIAKQYGIHVENDIFFNGKELIGHIENQMPNYDLIFLDIEMEYMNGMETACRIREKDKQVLIIFVTSHVNYAVEAYAVHPFQFIVKPIEKKKFVPIFLQAYEVIIAGNVYYEYKYNKDYYRILIKDIMYFESEKRIINIHLKDGSIRHYYDKIDFIQKRLSETKVDFWRIHQSILVNTRYVVRKAFDHIELTDGRVLNISEGKRKELAIHYMKATVKRMGD